MSKAEVISFGCRLNSLEGDQIAAHLDGTSAQAPRRIVINTCAVTQEAERQARQAIRRARRRHPDAEIVVTGCAAQINPAAWAALTEVNRVVDNLQKLDAATWKLPQQPEPRQTLSSATAQSPETLTPTQGRQSGAALSIKPPPEPLPSGKAQPVEPLAVQPRTRAFVQVQNGCDHRCTFCIIPFGRGASRSQPPERVIQQIRRLLEAGSQEVVITGVDLTAYGADLPERLSLGGLLKRVFAELPELPRLRLSSLDCIEIDPELTRLIAEEERLMPHLHLSLQAGSDLILKRMKRRHLRRDAVEFCQRVCRLRPDMTLGADLIAGFPTETEAQFAESLALVDDCGLAFVHVFPYSERPGTPAARMPQVAKPERKARAARLREKAATAFTYFLHSQVGQTQDVLVEQGARGRGANFAPYQLEGLPAGQRYRVRATGVVQDRLLGEVL